MTSESTGEYEHYIVTILSAVLICRLLLAADSLTWSGSGDRSCDLEERRSSEHLGNCYLRHQEMRTRPEETGAGDDAHKEGEL